MRMRGLRGHCESSKTQIDGCKTNARLRVSGFVCLRFLGNIIDAHGKPCAIACVMRLRFLTARACVTNELCMMTGAKHRARSARGARGSNPSQKTPRQRSARSALSTHFARSAKCVASYSKARGNSMGTHTASRMLWPRAILTRNMAQRL